MKPIHLALAGLLLALTPRHALADIPPPDGYVEQCTIAKVCKSTEEGDSCFVMDYKDPTQCARKHAKDGFTFKCKAGGGHSWTEIFCRPKAAKK